MPDVVSPARVAATGRAHRAGAAGAASSPRTWHGLAMPTPEDPKPPPPGVIDKLRQLHGQLEQAPSIPEVDELKHHVSTVLAEPEHRPHYGPLRERLARALERLEARYPELATTIDAVNNELIAVGL